jgi:nitroreductase
VDVIEAINSRKSIRAFRPDPVPKDVMEEILRVAIRTPSRANTQPWEITVVTGKVLGSIGQGNVEMIKSGAKPNPDVRIKPSEGLYQERQMKLAAQLGEVMGIARDDNNARVEWFEKGMRFFDAPVAIIISGDRSLDEAHTQYDIGAITQTICIAALNFGLGTCIEAQSVMYPEVVRKYTGIPESRRITISIALGYPDLDFPANTVKTQREPLESVVTWYGFD